MELSKFLCWGDNRSPKNENLKNEEDSKRRKVYFKQFMSILSAFILMIDIGAHLMWTSPALPFLTGSSSHIPISTNEAYFLVPIYNLSSVVGTISYSVITNQVGRKITMMFLAALELISWIIIDLANNYTQLCVSMVIFGLCYGAACSIIPIYISEISEKNIRGIYISLITIFMNIGSFLMVTCGALFTYNTMNLMITLLPILSFILSIFMLESPYFHLIKSRDEKAVKTLIKLSAVNDPKTVMEDIERMKKTIVETNISMTNITRQLLTNGLYLKAFIILIISSVMGSLSGYIAIQSYAEEILGYSNSSLEPEYGTMILMGIQIFASIPTSLLIDNWGRKPTYLLSGILSALNLGVVGMFYLVQYFFKYDVSSFSWIPLIFLTLFMVSCNLGINTIPFVYAGELFPIHVKGIASMCGGIVFSLGTFISTLLLPFFNAAGFIYIAFWIYSFFCISGPLIVWFTMPETKGKNLEEVLMLLSSPEKKKEERVNVC